MLCWVCGVLGHLAPVHRCARSLCFAVGCVCGVACAGCRCGAHTRPSGRRLFVTGGGWVPSGHALVRPDGGCLVAGGGWVSSGRAIVHPDGGCSAAGRGCVRCLARTRPSGRRLVLLGTCSRAVVRCMLCALSGFAAPGGPCCRYLSVCPGCGRRRTSLACLVAPRGATRLVRSGRSWCSGWLSRRRGAFSQPRVLRPRLYWVAARGTRRPAENRAHCACRWPPLRQGRWARSASYPLGGPRWGCPWWVPPALVLGCVRCGGWRVWTRSLTRLVFPYRPSFDGGLGRCIGAVSCGRRHLTLRVGGRHARVPCVCACA